MKSGTRPDQQKGASPPESEAAALAPSVAADSDEDGDDVLQKGTSVGRYLVLGRLGAGAMGEVYAAYDPELDRKIALKLLRAQQGKGDKARRQERLVREAKAIAKLSHPNVVGIFDVGVHDGQVFLAMEYLGGGTLDDWCKASTRPWREVVKMFIEVGEGLAAAHAEGLIHRDFKPDNVLLDKQGKPKVADFGLVRLQSAGLDVPATASGEMPPDSPDDAAGALSLAAPAALTRTGALAGTPAYMAPEQFLGRSTDARTDQFAFCVSLYEALYGERPFAGDTVMALGKAVVAGRVREPPKDSAVPAWIRRHVQRGLRSDPSQRHDSVAELLLALSRDPVVRVRRRAGVVAAILALIVVVALVHRRGERRRMEFERQIADRVADATKAQQEATRMTDAASKLRTDAIGAFADRRRHDGERIWVEAKKMFTAAERSWERADRSLQATVDLDRQRASVREKLSDVLLNRMLFDELMFRKQGIAEHLERLRSLDPHGRSLRSWSAPGTVVVTATSGTVKVAVQAATADHDGRMRYGPQAPAREAPLTLSLEPGSYRLLVESPGRASVVYPLAVARGSHIVLPLKIPRADAIPGGFVFVPEGDVLFGEYDENLRTSFLDTVPIHSVHVKPYAIARHETSIAEWIAFLESMDERSRDRYLPSGKDPGGGSVRLRREGTTWIYYFNPWSKSYRLPMGTPIRYAGRTLNAVHEWETLPVTGVSPRDAETFTTWLRKTKRVPGARLCSEYEWERAARGSDARIYPHGDLLAPADANFDASHAHSPQLFGLDGIGSHPESDSPFGVSDLAGNANEITRSALGPEQYVIRGGSYYQDANTARVTNRAVITPMARGQSLGFRVCADVEDGR